ncbi:lysine N(6)-hydroxylase/L-ornithine N(5)-oxygenase family protein [Antribacter gilvus]|uniref:lysine N(6)-hydroxylase/L-ornithine N(5)-oxygenase family protein n=1 Tax=Antribacter gilvus TaxID=2304675 RepID=UPI000F7B8292|nr:SidA/IucD/PvdA family monooxygenase [Antribacter gilvus]
MQHVHDVVGVGFGPSNISVAVAAREAGTGLSTLFVDRKPAFSWHEGLMFEGAEMQVSFLKDLVTMRNPRSRFSFLNYLEQCGRLAHFINLRQFYPTRIEFNDYYRWVADELSDVVRWSTEVVDVRPTSEPGEPVEVLAVILRDMATGREHEVLTRSLVLAPGGEPVTPSGAETGPRVFHASRTRELLPALLTDTGAPYTVNIVGAGQTAADVFLHVRRTYPEARVVWSFRGFAPRPEDDTHFVNELFLPETTDWFYEQSPEFRAKVLDDYRLAAHTGVSYDVLPQIYKEVYADKVAGALDLEIQRYSELVTARGEDSHAVATYRRLDTGALVDLEADVVVLATGYRYAMPVPALAPLERWLDKDDLDRYVMGRDYSVSTSQDFRAKVFLQGFAEHTHGFSEVLLSLMPFRAAAIVDAAGLARVQVAAP